MRIPRISIFDIQNAKQSAQIPELFRIFVKFNVEPYVILETCRLGQTVESCIDIAFVHSKLEDLRERTLPVDQTVR